MPIAAHTSRSSAGRERTKAIAALQQAAAVINHNDVFKLNCRRPMGEE
jgi:hypothetical protein